jgi:hypothetical protein
MEFEADYADTDPRALEVMYDLQRKMPPEEKIAWVFQLSAMALSLAEAGVRAMYPQAGEDEVVARLAARHLDRELVIRAYGWYPDDSHASGPA